MCGTLALKAGKKMIYTVYVKNILEIICISFAPNKVILYVVQFTVMIKLDKKNKTTVHTMITLLSSKLLDKQNRVLCPVFI